MRELLAPPQKSCVNDRGASTRCSTAYQPCAAVEAATGRSSPTDTDVPLTKSLALSLQPGEWNVACPGPDPGNKNRDNHTIISFCVRRLAASETDRRAACSLIMSVAKVDLSASEYDDFRGAIEVRLRAVWQCVASIVSNTLQHEQPRHACTSSNATPSFCALPSPVPTHSSFAPLPFAPQAGAQR